MWRIITLLFLTLAGCRFTVLGAYDDGNQGVGGNATADGAAMDLASSTSDLDPSADLMSMPVDMAVDPCGVSAPPVAGSASAACTAGGAPKIDGALDDWAAATFIQLTHANAAFSKGSWVGDAAADDANSSGSFAVTWDPGHLYLAARVNDDVRGVFPSSSSMAQDDSVQIFLDGNHDRVDGAYNTDDHDLVITADGRGQDAQYGQQPHVLPSGVSFAVGSGPATGYTVEIAIPWSVLGSAAARGGRDIGFDFAISDDDSSTFQLQSRLLIWKFTMPTSGCTTSPTCNTQIFGELQLLGH